MRFEPCPTESGRAVDTDRTPAPCVCTTDIRSVSKSTLVPNMVPYIHYIRSHSKILRASLRENSSGPLEWHH